MICIFLDFKIISEFLLYIFYIYFTFLKHFLLSIISDCVVKKVNRERNNRKQRYFYEIKFYLVMGESFCT